MSGRGKAMMGSGVASGPNRAEDAVSMALSSPLLENIDLTNASGVLVNITAGADLSSKEFSAIGDKVKEIADDSATIIIGCIKEEDNLGDLRVTIVATGFDASKLESDVTNVGVNVKVDDEVNQPKNVNASPITSSTIQGTLNTEGVSDMPKEVIGDNDIDNIDVPAFLRQQAD
tara:strand:- start:25 stop:546 length:522 start_codon:yes stop_codon:yes gene_type:complete